MNNSRRSQISHLDGEPDTKTIEDTPLSPQMVRTICCMKLTIMKNYRVDWSDACGNKQGCRIRDRRLLFENLAAHRRASKLSIRKLELVHRLQPKFGHRRDTWWVLAQGPPVQVIEGDAQLHQIHHSTRTTLQSCGKLQLQLGQLVLPDLDRDHRWVSQVAQWREQALLAPSVE